MLFSIMTLQFTFPLRMQKGSLFSTPSPTLPRAFLATFYPLRGDIVSLMISEAEHLFMYFLAIYMSSLEKYLFLCPIFNQVVFLKY